MVRYLVLALLLFFSWYLLPIWEGIDLAIYHFLQMLLSGNYLMQVFVALSNVRAFDLFGAGFMISFSLIWAFDAESKQERNYRLVQFLYTVLWFEIGILSLKQVIFPYLESIGFYRHSPTLVVDSPILLSQMVPWLKIKDSSIWSFPSDHALIIIQWSLFMLRFGGKKIGAYAFLGALFFTLPRLFAGAHWVSDALCGSLPLALIITAIATKTCLYSFFMRLFFRNQVHASLQGPL